MKFRVSLVGLAAIMACLMAATSLAAMLVIDDFEWALGDTDDPSILATRNWRVFGNVRDHFGGYLYGYDPGYGFCRLAVGEGGPDQGSVQLVVSSDYDNVDHADSNLIEVNLYQEWVLGPEHVGHIYQFSFDAKRGDLEGASTAMAFVKTMDPSSGYALTNFIARDLTSISEDWGTYWLQITIGSNLLGQILQMGFSSTATNYEGAAIYYDNVEFGNHVTAAPSPSTFSGALLNQNYPNPFNASTTIDFELSSPSVVSLRIYDLFGHLVRTLVDGQMAGIGRHEEVWFGRDDAGRSVASGVYLYRLSTGLDNQQKSMVLVK